MTIQELAKICGVSPATVSRAIKGQVPVSRETRRRIDEAITRYQYTPRPVKRTKKTGKSGLIGVMLPAMDHPFAQCLIREIQKQAGRYHLAMIVLPERENALRKQLEKLPLDGVILLSAEITPDTIDQLKQLRLAIVMCSALPLAKNFPSVHVDDLAAAYDGTRYLLELGHRRIGFITDSPRSIDSGFQRIVGCRKAMEDQGLPAEEDLFFSGNCDYDSGFQGAKQLLADHPGLTALFAHSDISALGAIASLADQGIRVPADVSVLGFDGIWSGEWIRPRLTCVHQPVAEIVEKTLELLTGGIECPGEQSPLSIILKHSIMLRESCLKILA
jgi:DNA-binding LacI/PurR family transcriptional regulator